MTELEAAYLAGLFDGEGCVGVYRLSNGRKTQPSGAKVYWSIKTSISGCHKPMLEFVYSRFVVGTLYAATRQKLYQRIGTDHTRRDEYGKQTWRWQSCSKADSLKVFEVIRPYLIEKAEQVDLAVAYCKGEMGGEEASDRLKNLKNVHFPLDSNP